MENPFELILERLDKIESEIKKLKEKNTPSLSSCANFY